MLKLKLQYFGHLIGRADSLEKTLRLGKNKGRRRGATEDEMLGWHHQLKGHESEQTLKHGEGQGSLVCCSPRGCRELDTTEQLTNNVANEGFIQWRDLNFKCHKKHSFHSLKSVFTKGYCF